VVNGFLGTLDVLKGNESVLIGLVVLVERDLRTLYLAKLCEKLLQFAYFHVLRYLLDEDIFLIDLLSVLA